MLQQNGALPRATSPVYDDYHYNNMTTFIFLKRGLYWLCLRTVGKVAGGRVRRLATRTLALFLSVFLPFLLSLVLI